MALLSFASEEERQRHAFARLIPKVVWEEVFSNQLTEFELSLMAVPAEEARIRLVSESYSSLSFQKKQRCLCALLFSEPPKGQLFYESSMVRELHGLLRDAATNGHLPVINRLIEIAPDKDKVQEMVAAGYGAFWQAASNSYLLFINRLKVQEMVAAYDYEAFRNAAEKGHLPVINRLIEIAPDKVQEMVAADHYEAFRFAAKNGHFPVINRLIEIAPDKVQEMVAADHYEAFRKAASYGHLPVINRLQEMVAARGYGALWQAIPNGFLLFMNRLKVQEMVAAHDYDAFRSAATYGHFPVINRLIEIAPDKVQEMVGTYDYAAFRSAASYGHLPVINRLIEIAPDKVQEMVAARDYEAFRNAASYGLLPVINRLIEIAPDKVQEMVAARDYEAFRNAATRGLLPVINRLIEIAPDKVQEMVAAWGYDAFRSAATRGHLPVINRLIEIAPDKVQEMVAAGNYKAFKCVARDGQLLIMNRLIEIAPDKVQEMVAAGNYAAFRSAAYNGHLPVINRLIEIAPDKVQEMVADGNYLALGYAVSRGHLPLINRLLLIPAALAYAEMHEQEYGARYVHPFIQTTLTSLRGEIAVFEQEHLNGVFDIADPEKAKLYFYMIRNLIRRNDATLLDDLRFLLRIPAVKALAHTAVTPGEPNELMRLALRVGNQGAAEILLTIPAVRVLTEQNNFYRTEQRRGIDFAALARDRESSMRALSTDEQRRLKKATERYQPLMKSAGVPNIMSDLRKTLEYRYDENPAFLTRDDQEIIKLPINWASFNQLTLNPKERARALTAYYQNKDHSAWRYLSKPNPWMAPNASYVYVNPDNREERWSTFEEYQPLISTLYLAATDASTPATDGWTLETRLEHFIDELAHIGRAHNWDDTRERTNAQGEVCREEYDNLKGDKPSCYSGVNRRLFQSVMGHPLLTFLTLNGVKQELREFMRDHFKELIKALGSDDLGKVWATFCETGLCTSDWDALNVPPEKQAAFLAHLAREYKTGFTDYPEFIKYVNDSFLITSIYPAHVVRFAGETSFGDLLPNITDAAIDGPQPISAVTAPASGIETLKAQLAHTRGARCEHE
jgi:hypothetical protein